MRIGRVFRRFRCRAHTRYAALVKPRVACEGCWWVWFHYRQASVMDLPRLVKDFKGMR